MRRRCGDSLGELFARPVSSTDPGARGVGAVAAAPTTAAPHAAPAAGAVDALHPHIVQAPQDATAAVGGLATFSVRADGPCGLSYQWQIGRAHV